MQIYLTREAEKKEGEEEGDKKEEEAKPDEVKNY